MSIDCNVTPGQIYGPNNTVDYGDLNKLGTPGVTVPDGGTLAFAVGTALLPSISIAGNTSTGFFQPTVNELAVAIAGTERLKFTADGLVGNVRAGAGTSAAPTLAFATDPDTGFFLAAGNTIGVAGSLAITDGSAAAPALTFASDTDTGLARTAANTMVATCGGTAVATFSATGIDAVGLKVNGSAIGLPGVDRAAARFADDFHGLITSHGWGVYTSADYAAISQLADTVVGNARGVVRMEIRVEGRRAEIAYPYITGLVAGDLSGTYYTKAGPCFLTPFTTNGEYVEFGLKFIGTIGAATPAFTFGLSYVTYSAGSALIGNNPFVGVTYRKSQSSYFRLSAKGSTGSALETTNVVPTAGTYYRIRITCIGGGRYTVHINDVLAATTATAVTIAKNMLICAGMETISGEGLSPYLELDYVQWECPITRA